MFSAWGAHPVTPKRQREPHPTQGITAAVIAAASAICAIAMTFFQRVSPITGRSGTTMVSPGRTAAESTLVDHHPP